ncbi:hypothetical protein JW898_00325 [Candidatus Woesearchaeota archaeon]|nr:hypothetical protein [Candidatus Woesearchaeota archaeon]
MMRYSLGQDMIFVIMALISALALLSQHAGVSAAFFIISILFIIYENRIYAYLKEA